MEGLRNPMDKPDLGTTWKLRMLLDLVFFTGTQ